MSELKPCPFCGGDPYIAEFSTGWHVECPNDECTHKPALWDMFHMEEQAIKVWNTRHIPEGYKLVPIEPTKAMLKASEKVWEIDCFGSKMAWPSDIYKAMLVAADEKN